MRKKPESTAHTTDTTPLNGKPVEFVLRQRRLRSAGDAFRRSLRSVITAPDTALTKFGEFVARSIVKDGFE